MHIYMKRMAVSFNENMHAHLYMLHVWIKQNRTVIPLTDRQTGRQRGERQNECVSESTHVYTCKCVCVCMCVHVRVCVCVCMHVLNVHAYHKQEHQRQNDTPFTTLKHLSHAEVSHKNHADLHLIRFLGWTTGWRTPPLSPEIQSPPSL